MNAQVFVCVTVLGRLTGMNETSTTVSVAPQNTTRLVLLQKVANVANVGVVPSGEDNIHR